ncbi:MAG: hypothetical protein CO118_02860 [Flavobacteriales bacterium CG_4_9_14_3_um_filter_32_8]|nr:MAG: hypothetical protein CO118_02860 [Flavobacteriales bacterium CG_4_9_14_3_um_filter_32_8]
MVLLLLIMLFFPEKGIKIGSITLQFPTIGDFFSPPNQNDSLANYNKDVASLFDSTVVLSKVDSAIIQHKLDSLQEFRKRFQVTDRSKSALHRFFEALDNANNQKVRIMHYGDSQIEADRITSFLRNELQNKFGGYGVGLFSIIQVAPSMSVNIEYSDNWTRYAGFGNIDSSIPHRKYGALMSFSRFAPFPTSLIINDSIQYEAWVKIKKPRISYGRTKTYSQLRIFLSNSHTNIAYKITADGSEVKTGTITPNTPFQTLNANFSTTPEEIMITFSGSDSPDIYGISLEGGTGIVMDNIPLRGSSGTVFTKQDATLLGNMYANLAPNLIILEFGGNTIPYIDSEKACTDYGGWFQSQINFIKKLNPNAAIIVIGPGDMSIKEKTEYVTYPYLEGVRDALKKAAINSGCIFWDMYEVMGGKNSMPKWVAAEPSLAASDYTHFSPLGAKKIAEEFNAKLFQLYEEYKHPNQKNKSIANDSIQ